MEVGVALEKRDVGYPGQEVSRLNLNLLTLTYSGKISVYTSY